MCVETPYPFSVCCGWRVFLTCFLVWLVFSMLFGFCLVLCRYCSDMFLLELLGLWGRVRARCFYGASILQGCLPLFVSLRACLVGGEGCFSSSSSFWWGFRPSRSRVLHQTPHRGGGIVSKRTLHCVVGPNRYETSVDLTVFFLSAGASL